jgi:transcriptional regulator with XRE-family HTH domain
VIPPPELTLRQRFGENLLRIRQARKYSQEYVAERAGIHRTQISLFEGGRRQPLLGTVVQLAGALEVPIELLCEGIRWVPASIGNGRFVVDDLPELPRFSARPDKGIR